MRLMAMAALAAGVLAFGGIVPSAAETLSVTQYGRINATLPFAIADKKGFYKAEGLNIDKIIPGEGGGTALRNMLASDLPYGIVATSTVFAALKAGADVRIVHSVSDNIGEIVLTTRPGSPLRSVKDLAGKTVGFTAPRSTTEWMMRLVLHKHGMTDKVTLRPTSGFGPGLVMLAQGAIDAVPLTDPILTLDATKYQTVFAFADEIPRVTWLVGITTGQFAERSPDKLRALLRAYRKSVDFLYANRADATAIFAEVWGLERAQADRLLPKYFDLPGEWTRGEFGKEGLATMSDALQLVGDLDKPADWPSLVDQRFLADDLKRPL